MALSVREAVREGDDLHSERLEGQTYRYVRVCCCGDLKDNSQD